MERVAVQSSSIHSIGYDDVTQTLEVQFLKNGEAGAIWQYSPVPVERFNEATMPGGSLGRFVNVIKADPAITAVKVEMEEVAS